MRRHVRFPREVSGGHRGCPRELSGQHGNRSRFPDDKARYFSGNSGRPKAGGEQRGAQAPEACKQWPQDQNERGGARLAAHRSGSTVAGLAASVLRCPRGARPSPARSPPSALCALASAASVASFTGFYSPAPGGRPSLQLPPHCPLPGSPLGDPRDVGRRFCQVLGHTKHTGFLELASRPQLSLCP